MTWGTDIRTICVRTAALVVLGIFSLIAGALSQPLPGSDASNPVVIEKQQEIIGHRLSYHYELRDATRFGGVAGGGYPGVRLEIVVAPDGRVVSAEPVDGERDWYDRAVSVARAWQYRPFDRDGRGVYAKIVEYAAIHAPEVRPEKPVSFPTIRNWNSLRITLTRNIPQYTVEVRGDGTVIYQGGGGAAVGGRHQTKIPQDAVRSLFEAFRAADYFSTLDNYVVTAWHFGDYATSIAFDGRRKSVRNLIGVDLGLPTSVAELENAIDRVVGSRKWTHITPETIPTLVSENYFKKRERDTSILATMILAGASPEIVRELIGLGASLNSRIDDTVYGTPLSAAAGRGNVEIVQILLAAGAGRNDRAQLSMALFTAAEACSVELVRTFLRLGANPNYTNRTEDWTPLILAASKGSPDATAALIAAGARVDAEDDTGATALALAAGNADRDDPKMAMAYEDTVRLLLEAGANPIACDDEGSTPFHGSRNPVVTKMLFDRGARQHHNC